MAANLDRVLIFCSYAAPPFRKNLVTRMLIAAKEGKVEPYVLVNKRDLAEPELEREVAEILDVLEVPRLSHSNLIEADKDGVLDLLCGRRTLLTGHSGVGKSSLVRTLFPDLEVKVGDGTTKNEKGRHVTSLAQAYRLDDATWVFDTPGVREFEPYLESPDELRLYFPVIYKFSGSCKFSDCSHRSEPGCFVKRNVETGDIPADIYRAYSDMLEALAGKEAAKKRNPT